MSQHTSKTILKLIAAVCAVMFVLFLSAVPAAADADVPALPMQIYGTVIDDTTLTDLSVGKIVMAYANNSEVGRFTVSSAGCIGGSGIWDDKLLIQSKNIDDGDVISFEVDGVKVLKTLVYHPGESVSVKLAKPGDEPSPKMNAETKAASIRKVTADEIETILIPNYTDSKSDKSISLNESVVVSAVIGGVKQTLPATIENGHVKLENPAPAGAEDIKVTFFGRDLGDVNNDGKVDVFDAAAAARCGVGSLSLSSSAFFYGDINGDGSVDVFDAGLAARYGVKLLDADYNEK